ncbi:MAG: diguanylate cyclase domain-containing protein [Spirochaetota bacterium]
MFRHIENSNYAVLVVSSDVDFVSLVSSHLDPDTYTVLTSANGMEALSILTYRIPHVIITEMDIPEISGIEFIRRLKKGVKTRFIPCILVGPPDDMSSKIEAIDAGVDSYITTPVNGDELRVLVKTKISQADDLYLMTISDDLTRLATRKEFTYRFNYHVDNGAHDILSLVIIDIDYFKSVNDDYGHQVGDIVLISLADMLRDMEGDSFFPARFGGEEFVILLPGLNSSEAKKIAEQLRGTFERMEFKSQTGENSFNVTFSAGIAEYPAMADNMSGLLARADQALYAAKNDGRNRSYVFSPIMARNDRFWEYIKSTRGGRGTLITFPYNESTTGFPFLPFVIEELLINDHPVTSIGIFSLEAAPIYDPFTIRGIRNYLYDIESLSFFLTRIFDAHFPYERYIAVSDIYSYTITTLFPFPTNVSQNRERFYNLCKELALDIYLGMNNYPVDIVFANQVMDFDRSSAHLMLKSIEDAGIKTFRIFGKGDDFSSFSDGFTTALEKKENKRINDYIMIRTVFSLFSGKSAYLYISNHNYTTRNDYGDLLMHKAFSDISNGSYFIEQLASMSEPEHTIPLLFNHPPTISIDETLDLLIRFFPEKEVILLLDEQILEKITIEQLAHLEKTLPKNITFGLNNCFIGSQIMRVLSVINISLIVLSESITRNIHFFKDRIKIINGLKMFADQLSIPLCARNIINEEEYQLIRDLKIEFCTGPYPEQIIKKMQSSRFT